MSRPVLDGLRARAAAGRPILTGVIGAGDFGADVVTTMAQAPGMVAAAVADLDVEAAIGAYCAAGHARADVVSTERASVAADAVRAGRPVAVPDGALLAELPLEAVVDSTGVPDTGADLAARCLRAGQHVVMVNVEADIVVGAALRRIADAAGVVYTLADGDQPSLICGLADFAAALGLEVVAGGKGTHLLPPGHPRRVAGENNPPRGKRTWVMDHEGTKTQIEMAAAANVLGWGVDVRGLHGPSARLEEVATLFGPRQKGGLFAHAPVVDYVNCLTPDGNTTIDNPLVHGVFVVVTSPNPHTLHALRLQRSADERRRQPRLAVAARTTWSAWRRRSRWRRRCSCAAVRPRRGPSRQWRSSRWPSTISRPARRWTGWATIRCAALPRWPALRPSSACSRSASPRGSVCAGRSPPAPPLTYDDLEAPGDTPCWRLSNTQPNQ